MLYKRYLRAQSLAEAVEMLKHAEGGRARLLAGGTDLMLQLHERILSADTVIDISRVPELCGVWVEDGEICIGAATTFAEIARSSLVHQHASLLAQAARQIGAAQIQNMATIGGNIGNASPAADALPCLYALEAQVVVCGLNGERRIPIEDFQLGYRKLDLLPGELIRTIRFRIPQDGTRTAFYKYGLRKSQAIAVVNAAAVLHLRDGQIDFARIALGAVAPTTIRSRRAEAALIGQPPTEDTFHRAGDAARSDASPISDVRGSAAFRRYLIAVSVIKALRAACLELQITEEAE